LNISISSPKRGEVWWVNFDPTVGEEIKKKRPAVVISSDSLGALKVKLVAPFTAWDNSFADKLWLVPINPDGKNGLTKLSAVDALQIRGVAVERFINKAGQITPFQLEEIISALAIVIEFQ
jgi:mRNA interferase MazF